jgi:phosphoribosylamine--glycine ligase
MAAIARCVPVDLGAPDSVLAVAVQEGVDLTVVGPELPLSRGVVDVFSSQGRAIVGPTRDAAALEWSKAFAKDFMARHSVPTARFRICSSASEALEAVAGDELGYPLVIKADGLAAGKGVVIAEDREVAVATVRATMIDRQFGEAGDRIVLEEFLAGQEASYFALVDGTQFVPLSSAQDHKRIHDDDRGPNTGGMGAFAPSPLLTAEMEQRVVDEIVRPVLAGLQQENRPYNGFLYVGLMLTAAGPKVIEFNVRFGDPEAQVLMMRLKSDLLPALVATADGVLKTFDLRWHDDAALTVVMASKGYPGSYAKGTPIGALDAARAVPGVELFHAGTAREGGQLRAVGGRVLNVTARGKTVGEAQRAAYEAVNKIDWPGGFCRKDIGWRAIERERKT